MTMKLFKIRLAPVVALTDSSAELIEASIDLEIVGATIAITTGIDGDYLNIKDGKGAVVFAAPYNSVRYCYVENSVKASEITSVKSISSGEDNK